MNMMLRMSRTLDFDANCTQKEVTDISAHSIKPSGPSEPSVIYIDKQKGIPTHFLTLLMKSAWPLYSELKLRYPGNRWQQMIAEGNRVVSMVTEMVTGGNRVIFFLLCIYQSML